MSASRPRSARAISDGCGGSLWRYLVVGLWWLLTAGGYIASFALPHYVPEMRRPPHWALAMMVVDLLLGLLSMWLIRYRFRRPVALAVALTLMSLISLSSAVTSMWAFAHVATRRRWREVIGVALAQLSVTTASVLIAMSLGMVTTTWPLVLAVADGEQSATWQDLVTELAMALIGIVVVVAIGFYVGARRELLLSLAQRAETAEREQELRVLQGQAEERNRIAREMHDVLAHRISLVSMHAGVLAYPEDLDREQTREIAGVIQDNAHQSMTELRAILGSLRQDGVGLDAPPEKPQPGLDGLGGLFDQARLAGQRVEVSDTVEHPELLPGLVGRHVYRVVQEVITNARKHAPDVLLRISLSGAPGKGYTIRGINPLRAGREPMPASGMGLIGLRERALVTVDGCRPGSMRIRTSRWRCGFRGDPDRTGDRR